MNYQHQKVVSDGRRNTPQHQKNVCFCLQVIIEPPEPAVDTLATSTWQIFVIFTRSPQLKPIPKKRVENKMSLCRQLDKSSWLSKISGVWKRAATTWTRGVASLPLRRVSSLCFGEHALSLAPTTRVNVATCTSQILQEPHKMEDLWIIKSLTLTVSLWDARFYFSGHDRR